MAKRQLNLFPETEADEETTAQRRFLAYHEAHPHIYEAMRASALDLRRRGWKHYGAKSVFEFLRFHTSVQASADYKLNNDYTSRYARLLMEREPELEGMFRTRRLRS